MGITRRTFVGRTVALGAGIALGQLPRLRGRGRAAAASNPGPDPGDSPSILYDLTRCVGCHLCEVACQANKGLPADISLLSFRNPNSVAGPAVAWAVRRHQCMHCLDPACASVCPVSAMYKTPEGPVIYRDERCIGCRYCMNACPFNVPTFDWDRGLLDGALIRKCNFCYERQIKGEKPACVEACPTGAVQFGKRGDLLAEAKRRIAEHPKQYVDYVYGETEAGGTSFLIIAGVPFAKLGLPKPGDRPLPPLSEKVMGLTIPVALSWATVLTGITGLVRWREKRMEENRKEGAQ
jgi:formate dehydrogenase iron-sulfur subunit